MTLDITKLKLPIQKFEVNLDDKFQDDRFEKVKIWIAHTGLNLNQTSFSSKAFEKMSKTLPYTPIVGYIKQVDDNVDFDGHNQRIIIEDDNLKIEYLPQPYGFIPENANAKIEYRDGKEWLTAEGYMWNKFPEGVEIIKNSMGSKSQSMEIDNISGTVSDEGVLNIDDARFSALCILGDDVSPAMAGSTIEMFSLKDADEDFKVVMRQMFKEYSEKGEKTLEDNIEVNDSIEISDTDTNIEVNDSEEVVEETLEEQQNVEEVEEEVSDEVKEDSEKSEEDLEEDKDAGRKSEVQVEKSADNQVDTEAFTKTILSLQAKLDALESENKELKEFKANVELNEKKEILDSYSKRLTEENIKDINSKINEFSINELEREIAFCIIKNEQAESDETSAKINSYKFEDSELNGRYGILDEYFK